MTRYEIPINDIAEHETPFYFYDTKLLNDTIAEIKKSVEGYPFKVHYAVKACVDSPILEIIASQGLGADIVSGGELRRAIEAGFQPKTIVFAGVGKSDKEIREALDRGLGCFNVESAEELKVISEISSECGKTANVALRVNPEIDAHTHHYITTGLAENKFGIALSQIDKCIDMCSSMPSVVLKGLHFHIGSQITDMTPYVILCKRINSLVSDLANKGVVIETINVGGGLGIDYDHPDKHPIPDFKAYFDVFKDHLALSDGQEVHFEIGRAIVGQCGSLITRVIYVKNGVDKKFIIVDAGMTDLIRPALYQAHHAIQNLTSDTTDKEVYDVVGPICESSDTFAEGIELPQTKRGDLIAIRSAGAYGRIMASQYNCRNLPGIFSR